MSFEGGLHVSMNDEYDVEEDELLDA